MPTAFLSPSIGLTNSDLENATASASDVLKGKTFYAGNSTIKTGTIPVRTTGEAKTINFWTNDSGEKFIQANTITEGYYTSSEKDYTPQINIPASLFGNAARTDVLYGKTFTSSNGDALIGSMTNRGAWNGTVNPGKSITIPAGYHNGSGKVTANTGDQPNLLVINKSGGWGSGTILSTDRCWTGSTNHLRMAFHWRAESSYNVDGVIRIMRNGSEVYAEGFQLGNGFIDKTFSQSGYYVILVRVDYNAGNGTFYIGGMMVGY